MTVSTQKKHDEQRWAVVLSILVVLGLLVEFPQRIRLFPIWVPYFMAAMEIISPLAVIIMPQSKFWQSVERPITFFFCFMAGILCMANLVAIIGQMLKYSEEVSGLQLLLSGLGIWTINILSFSIFYWLIDRGGPVYRSNNRVTTPDWLFPQEGAPKEDYPSDWRPAFLDYLFLGYCTASAFSPTDVLPLTHRAKMFMMLQSAISLLTVLIVMSRAINILG